MIVILGLREGELNLLNEHSGTNMFAGLCHVCYVMPFVHFYVHLLLKFNLFCFNSQKSSRALLTD